MESGGDQAGGAIAALLSLGCFAIIMLFSLAMFALWIWMLIECATKEPAEGNDKIMWLLIIIFLGGLGAIIYYFARRPQRIRQFGQ